jgi:hypothetical protein
MEFRLNVTILPNYILRQHSSSPRRSLLLLVVLLLPPVLLRLLMVWMGYAGGGQLADLGHLGVLGLASLAPEHGVEPHDDEHRAERAAEVQLLAEEQRAEHGHHQQHQRVEDGGEERAAPLHAPGEHHQHDARGEDARVDDGEEPDVEAEAPLRDVPVVAEREGDGLQGAHDAHDGCAGVVEGVLFAELGLEDEPERVEEAAADAEQRAHDAVGGLGLGGGRVQPSPSMLGASAAVPGRDVGALVEGEQHGPGDAEEGAGELGLAGAAADGEALVAEDEGEEEGEGRDEVGGGGGEGGGGELHAGDVQVLRQRASALHSDLRAEHCIASLLKLSLLGTRRQLAHYRSLLVVAR